MIFPTLLLCEARRRAHDGGSSAHLGQVRRPCPSPPLQAAGTETTRRSIDVASVALGR